MDPVDLTRRLEPGMPVYPGDDGVSATATATIDAEGYRTTRLSFSTHTGTHVDAPAHMEPDGATLDEFDAADFRFDARLVDLTGEGGAGDGGLDPRQPITPELLPVDLAGVDGAGDDISDGAARDDAPDLLALRTGWGDHWGDERYFDHPYLTAEAASVIAEAGCAVGLDTINPDPTPTDRPADGEPEGVPAHHELLGRGRLIVENLRLPAGLPERFTLRAYPLRVDADGAPARAVAERVRPGE